MDIIAVETISEVLELALTGEVRSVVNVEKRIKEAVKLGFTTIYTTKYGIEKANLPDTVKVIKVNNIKDLLGKKEK